MAEDNITRKKISIWVWLLVALVVFGLSAGLGVLVTTWQSQKLMVVENKQGLYTPQVSDKSLEAYLEYTGYREQVEQVILTYELAELESIAYARGLPDETLDVMVDVGVEEKVVRLWMYYNPELFEHMLVTPERLEADVLAGVCLALNPGTMPDCYEQAFGYIEWAEGEGIVPVIQPAKERSWWRLLVPQAYAQSCSGTIPWGVSGIVCNQKTTTV